MNEKVAWNLSVNEELKRQMQIYCAANGEEISEVTEGLYRELLKKRGIRIAETSHSSTQSENKNKNANRVSYSKSSKRRTKK